MKLVKTAVILLLTLVVLTSCKIGRIGDVKKLAPVTDEHMHGLGSSPTSHPHYHGQSHPHPYPCEFNGKAYTSTVSCGEKFEHMHGPDEKPHIHLTQDTKHGRGFQCMYQGKGKLLSSDKDCGVHVHQHFHGLQLTETDPHGIHTQPHSHDHKHTDEHAHNHDSHQYKCGSNKGSYLSNVPCKVEHDHIHMHTSNEPAHSHKHDHEGEHRHQVDKECIGYGNDHDYYFITAGKCSYKHTHDFMRGVGAKPSSIEHSHRIGAYRDRHVYRDPHRYPCVVDGKVYYSDTRCLPQHTHEHSHIDNVSRKKYTHNHQHETYYVDNHHPQDEEPEEVKKVINQLTGK